MTIGVVADTHSREVPQQLIDDFQKAEFIVHAGDFCSLQDYDLFAKMKDLKAVYGNMDELALQKKLPEKMVFSFGEFQVGLYHGRGAPQQVLDVVRNDFKKEKVDAVIFGHSHQPLNETIDGVLYFNPGSPNDIVTAPYCSYGFLEAKNGKLSARIVKVRS